ncbi:hypothetical protein ACFGVS_23670 [Mucilaginibacter sp. AW1-7]|uniref:hypothetical protein n=1 Tax=Mucilaginibacter sp. AW1-7 TaxID=3349874 RepID=UPI003F740CEA
MSTQTITQKSADYSSLTLHIVLATVPQRQEKVFNECIVHDFYGEYRKNATKYLNDENKNSYWNGPGDSTTPVLYNPMRYYLLGNYDVAYISLIDNFKFAQRVFEPQLLLTEKKGIDLFAPHTFQSSSGITYPGEKDLRRFFAKKLGGEERKYFLSITNLKLNNGFLIGNGNNFLRQAIEHVEDLIKGYNRQIRNVAPVEFLIMQSFSWFELSVLIFADDPLHISNVLKLLRRSTVSALTGAEQIVKDSLYTGIFKGEHTQEEISSANIFSDTQSYFGVNADLVDCPDDDSYLKDFYAKTIELTTEVEWQVKPGHMAFLMRFLERNASELFDLDNRFLLAGKNDYYVRSQCNEASFNVKLLRFIFKQDPTSELYNHVRKIKTRVQFKDGRIQNAPPRKILDLHQKLVKKAVTIEEFSKLDRKLKSLKISRQIRSKILKIFSNYNNGIQDIILFPYFLDFKLFISYLMRYINEMGDKLSNKFETPNAHYPELNMAEIEHALMHLIGIFQEGYNIRMLNGYQFEDINDFDLDFNSSLQQLLSAFSSVAIEVGNLFYKDPYFYGPIIALNLKDTVSNYVTINYYVHHLTSPEFVFATLTKEVINFLYLGDRTNRRVITKYEDDMRRYAIDNDMLKNLIAHNQVKISYLLNDATRFVVTYVNRFELYQYWFWTYNLQNTSLYDETGILNEESFRFDLFRIIFINAFFGHDKNLLTCPLPELYTLWDRNFEKTYAAVQELLAFMGPVGLCSEIMNYVISVLDLALEKMMTGLNIPGGQYDNGANFLNKIQKRYQSDNNDMKFLERLTRFVDAYAALDSGDAANMVETDSAIYLQWYILHGLETIFARNRKIVFLRRNWKNGKPLRSFVEGASDHLYAVDQTGGLFFDDTESIQEYFRLSCTMLSDIWDFSQKRKKNFILNMLAGKDGK